MLSTVAPVLDNFARITLAADASQNLIQVWVFQL
jgi:hypothetical protein